MSGTVRYKDGAWRIAYQADGHRHHATVHGPNNKTGRRDADKALAQLITQVDTGRRTGHSATVNDLLDAWLRHIAPTRAARTTDDYRSKARLHIRPALGPKRLDKITAYDIDHLHTTLRDKGLADKTIRHVDTTLHAALGHAVRWGWITTNPMAQAERIPDTRPELRVPSVDEVRAAIEAAEADFAAMIHTIASTGHRRGSLLGLRWPDIDTDHQRITFRRAIAHVPGQPLIVKETKARNIAVASLEPALGRRLAALRLRAAERSLACGAQLHDDAYLWSARPEGDRPWHPSSVPKRWAATCRAAGIEGVRFHDLKHFAVTQLLAEGRPAWEVAQRTGTSSATIERVYGHFIPGRDDGAAGVMDRLLG